MTQNKQMANKQKTAYEKYDYKFLFIIWVSIWSIDFLTTFLGLNLRNTKDILYEVNPLPAWFFSGGLIGFAVWFVIGLSLIFVTCFITCNLINSLKNPHLKQILFFFILILLLFVESIVILNNIKLLWRYI